MVTPDDHRLPAERIMGELENAGKRGSGGKEKEWTDCVAGDRRVLASRGTRAPPGKTLDPGVRYRAQYPKRAVGLWPRRRVNRKIRPKPAEEERGGRGGRGGQGCGYTWGDRSREHETF